MNNKQQPWLALVACTLSAFAWPADFPINIGDVPPDYLGKNGDGDKVHISDHRGKLMVVSFFATWCGPCRKEVPILANLQKAAGRDKLVVVAIDYKEERDIVRKVRRMFKDYELMFTHDYNGDIGAKFGVTGIPHMVIIGADGKLAARHVGYGENSLNRVVADINRIWRESQTQSTAATPPQDAPSSD